MTTTLRKLIDADRGFLPKLDPCRQLPEEFAAWEELARNLPKWLMSDNLVNACLALPAFPTDKVESPREQERAMVILSFIGHGLVWGNTQIPDALPEIIARAWYDVSQLVQRPPVLSYASYALHNWHRLDPQKPIALDNIALNQNFLGGQDEEWFVLIHVDIEAKAAPLLQALCDSIDAVGSNNIEATTVALHKAAYALCQVCDVLDRMPERCDPYIYYRRVRPYIHGWKNNPALPNGLRYTGVAAYQNQGQFFRGETGAQSSIMPALDAVFSIHHESDPLRVYLNEMRDYMPATHRRFIEELEALPILRPFVTKNSEHSGLTAAYNDCINLIDRFRKTHLGYATDYINKQTQTSSANPTETGTGGTPFMRYLKKHEVETNLHVLK